VLDASAHGALSVSGNGSVQASNGTIDVSSNAADALTASGNANVSALSIGAVGGVAVSGGARLSPSPVAIGGVADPFAGVPTPSLGGPVLPAVNVSGNQVRAVNPGTYKSITVSGNGLLELRSGIYVVTQAISVSGNGVLVGQGVLLYLGCGTSSAVQSCGAGQPGASFSVSGNGLYTLNGMTGGTYSGLTLFADRNNTSTIGLSSGATSVFTGGIYARSGAFTLTGSGGTVTLNGVIAVDTAAIPGNGALLLTASGGEE
jgi:hypothetical protein